jgi:hypothetical protein
MDLDSWAIDNSPFLIFGNDDEDGESFEDMTTRNSLLVDALGFPLTEMDSYLDCLFDQGYDIDFYLDAIENQLRLLGV